VQDPEKPFTLACRVGRLVELRVGPFTAREHMQQLQIAVADLVGSMKEPIGCFDLRLARVLPADIADAGVGVMRSDNRLFHMIALLASSPMLALQTARLMREANNPRRRLFEMTGELELWLQPHLNQAERQRLHEFLAQDPTVTEEPPHTPPTRSSSNH
jgi:hypothetical protein